MSCVYSITDKPILTRARASLPESYLYINKVNDGKVLKYSSVQYLLITFLVEYAVFAKKAIPKRSQFGPLEGILTLKTDKVKNELASLIFLIESNSATYEMDISDESR